MSKKAPYEIKPANGSFEIFETETEIVVVRCGSWNQAQNTVRSFKRGKFFAGFTPKFLGVYDLTKGV